MEQELKDRLHDAQVCSPAQNYCRNRHVMEEAANRIAELEEKLKVVVNDAKEAEDYAEELEAKLKTAIGALGDIYDGEPEWPDDPEKELEWCRNRAKRAHAELTGDQDGSKT